jgi:Reverse transcriptase (RNA-dependent DNA polymerase)
MQHYCFDLDDASKELCTIATPFGLYHYRHLPMGVNQSPDIAQEIMERVLSSIMEEIECYIDNITALSDDWESHKTLLNKLLTKLQNAGFTVNPLSVSGQFKKPISSVIGRLQPESNRGRRKFEAYSTCKRPPTSNKSGLS